MIRLSFLTTALLICSGCGVEEPRPPIMGDVAPSFKLKSINDQVISIDDIKGEIVVVSFWSTTCENCIQEIDDLNAIHESGDATVIGIALDEDPKRVRTLLTRKPAKYDILMGDQSTFEAYEGINIPYTIVLDRRRTVRKKFFGRMTPAQFEQTLEAIKGVTKTASISKHTRAPSIQ